MCRKHYIFICFFKVKASSLLEFMKAPAPPGKCFCIVVWEQVFLFLDSRFNYFFQTDFSVSLVPARDSLISDRCLIGFLLISRKWSSIVHPMQFGKVRRVTSDEETEQQCQVTTFRHKRAAVGWNTTSSYLLQKYPDTASKVPK